MKPTSEATDSSTAPAEARAKTRTFVGEIEAARLIIQRDTTYGLGGLRIEVRGDGTVSLRKEAFGPEERALDHTAKLDRAAVDRIFTAVIDEALTELVITSQSGMPGEIFVTIALLGAGGRYVRGKFGSNEVPGFTRIVELVRAEVAAVISGAIREKLTL